MNEITEYLKENLMLSDEEIPEFVICFLDSAGLCCSQLEQQYDMPDFGELRNITHTLAGIAGNVGAGRLLAPVQALNVAARAADSAGCRECIRKVLDIFAGYRDRQ